MNEYKLQYHYPESSIDTAYIVERTEAAARKTLIKRFGKEIEIDDTELVSTDANATKEQERETLEKIKAMVEELAAAQKRMEQSAETMAYYAEAPQDIAFAEAVKSYRAAKERRGVCEQIVKGLEALTEE